MAQKRMFDKTITNDDSFLEMPIGSQVLYFHLSMNADDDGFINNWKSIMRMIGAKEDDLKVLVAKSYVIPFETGVIVIKHWKINNYLRNDRYKPTRFQEEYNQLIKDNNLVYQLDTNGIPSIDKNSIDKNSIEKEINKEKNKYGEFNNVMLTEEEYAKLEKSNLLPYIEKLSSYIASKGKKYKSHYATILNWSRKESNGNVPEWFNKELTNEKVSAEDIKEMDKLQSELLKEIENM